MDTEKPSPIWLAASQASRLKRLAVKARRAWERYLGESALGKAEDKRREMMALEAGANLLQAEASRLRREAETQKESAAVNKRAAEFIEAHSKLPEE